MNSKSKALETPSLIYDYSLRIGLKAKNYISDFKNAFNKIPVFVCYKEGKEIDKIKGFIHFFKET